MSPLSSLGTLHSPTDYDTNDRAPHQALHPFDGIYPLQRKLLFAKPRIQSDETPLLMIQLPLGHFLYPLHWIQRPLGHALDPSGGGETIHEPFCNGTCSRPGMWELLTPSPEHTPYL